MARPLVLVSLLLVVLGGARVPKAHAQTPQGIPPALREGPRADPPTDLQPGSSTVSSEAARPLVDLQSALPPPTNIVYLQYGVAFTTEAVAATGPICNNVGVPCILGSGAGVAIRGGLRGTGRFYLGGAYELSKQDPQKLLRLAILQQIRGEGRYYFTTGRDVEPYLQGGLGLAGYGNEWSVDTWGPVASFGGGVELQINRRTVVGLALGYRFLYLQKFTDSAGSDRSAGLAQLFGLDLVLEQRDPIFTGR